MTTPSFLHTHAVILSTGDELVMGQLQDTNARWIAERLIERGVRVEKIMVVGDDLLDLEKALHDVRAPLVVMSGGLGATDGDLTRQAVCRVSGDFLETDNAVAAQLDGYLRSRGRDVTERQMRQALRPSRATPLHNAVGTAPGLHVVLGLPNGEQRDLVCLPGPPGELRPMWRSHVEPLLRPDPTRAVQSRLFYVAGMPEADAAERLRDLTLRGRDITVNLTASSGILTVRTRATGLQTADLQARYDTVLRTVRESLSDHCFAEAPASDTPATERLCAAVLDALKSAGQTLTTVESCTGGMLGQMLTAIPGSSSMYLGGSVTYSNELKTQFASVPAEVIAAEGAVSRETAVAMAVGGLGRTGASHALSITGIAGPEGGSAAKPVGTVWIALASLAAGAEPVIDARCFRFSGDRHDVRVRSCVTALTMLLFTLRNRPLGRLLWQHVP